MRYFLPFAAFLLLLSFSTDSFSQKKELRKAKSAYEDRDYYHCIEYFTQAEELGAKLGLEEKKLKARSLALLNKIGPAFDLYTEGIEESAIFDEDIFIFAQVLHKFGLYSDAITWYEKAINSGALPEGMTILRVKDIVESCRWALDNEHSSVPGLVVNPNFTLAAQGQSFGVQFYNDKVVYSSAPADSKLRDHDGNIVLNLYTSDFIDGEVKEGTVKVFSQALMTPYHVGAISFTSDKKHLYFTKSVDTGHLDHTMLKIFVADFNGKEWTNVRPLEFDSDDFDIAHPAVSLDDKYLYFVSNMQKARLYGKSVGNFGQKDIYRAEIAPGGDFSKFVRVENLGPSVNTYGDEVYPIINPDGRLYFSSDVHKGYGGLDLFCADYIDGKWQNVRNMLQRFNSKGDDFNYVMVPGDNNSGFLSSNNYGDQDRDVVFSVKRVEDIKSEDVEVVPVFGPDGLVLTGEALQSQAVNPVEPDPVVEPETKVEESPAPVVPEAPKTIDLITNVSSTYNNELIAGASVSIKNEDNEAEIAKLTTGADGKASLSMEVSKLPKGAELIIVVSKEGYNEKSLQISSDELIAIAKDGFKLTPIFNDAVLDDISGMEIAYDNDLDDAAKATLDKLAAYLLQNPGITVKLNAHTEAKGNRYGNLEISQKMADKAKAYLTSKGVKDTQLIPRGYGERYLKNRCHRGVYCDAAQHKVNRRVEVVVWNVVK